MPEIDFETKELLARARLEPVAAARKCGLKPAMLSLCIRGLRGWHPDDRQRLHDYLTGRIHEREMRVSIGSVRR